MAARCRIEMLGGLPILGVENEITQFRTRKAAELLVCLAYFRRCAHTGEILMELLWPECDPSAGRLF